MPFYASPQFHLNDRFMLASTRFWKPMLNGYSGFKPASFYKNVEALPEFSRRSIDCPPADAGCDARRGRRPQHGAGCPGAAGRISRSSAALTSDGTLRLYLLSTDQLTHGSQLLG